MKKTTVFSLVVLMLSFFGLSKEVEAGVTGTMTGDTNASITFTKSGDQTPENPGNGGSGEDSNHNGNSNESTDNPGGSGSESENDANHNKPGTDTEVDQPGNNGKPDESENNTNTNPPYGLNDVERNPIQDNYTNGGVGSGSISGSYGSGSTADMLPQTNEKSSWLLVMLGILFIMASMIVNKYKSKKFGGGHENQI